LFNEAADELTSLLMEPMEASVASDIIDEFDFRHTGIRHRRADGDTTVPTAARRPTPFTFTKQQRPTVIVKPTTDSLRDLFARRQSLDLPVINE